MKDIKKLLITANNNLKKGTETGGKKYFLASIKMYEEIIFAYPDFSIAHNNIGTAFHEIKDYDNATLSFTKAIAINDDKGNDLESLMYMNRGNSLKKLELEDRAFDDYQKSVDLNNKNYKSYYHLGIIESRRMNYFEAIDFFKKAKKSNIKIVIEKSNINIKNCQFNIKHINNKFGLTKNNSN